MIISDDSRDNTYVLCDQVDDLLNLVAELKEEVERLKSIKECEREIDWWSHTLPSLREMQWMEAQQVREALTLSLTIRQKET